MLESVTNTRYLQIQNLNTSVLQTLHITCYSRARQVTNPYYCFSYTAFHAQGTYRCLIVDPSAISGTEQHALKPAELRK